MSDVSDHRPDLSGPPGSSGRRPRLRPAVAASIALLALASALAAGHLVAVFVGGNASPYIAVGNAVVDRTPAWLKDWAVRTFGTYDKVVLLGGMAVVMVLVAIGAGLASRRRGIVGTAAVTVLGLLGVAAVLDRPDLGRLAVLAPVASLVAGVTVFTWLHTLAVRARGAAETLQTPEGRKPPMTSAVPVGTDRRRFLVGAGGVAFGAGAVGLGGELIGGTTDAAGSRAAVGRLRPADPAPAVPVGADFARLGTPSFITPNDAFYRIDTALVVPRVRAEDWTLRIHGMVDREITLTYADIRRRPLVERTITLCCVSNPVGGPYISNTHFIGVDLADLLAEAGVRRGAQQLFSTSADGWTCGTPVAAALDRERGALLAIGMNGRPLPLEHGFPARMVVPGLYGYVSATKWVTDMEITTWGARRAYWLERSWAREAPVKTQSRIDSPREEARLPVGKVTVAGTAWAQTTGIETVQVRLDGGPWREAELAADVSDDTWRMWKITLDVPEAGNHSVACRAVDKSGYAQTGERSSVLPDGATGWHTIRFSTR